MTQPAPTDLLLSKEENETPKREFKTETAIGIGLIIALALLISAGVTNNFKVWIATGVYVVIFFTVIGIAKNIDDKRSENPTKPQT